MKENFVNVVFVIDESGSMSGTEADVIGGFKKVVDEQKANDKGSCSVSYFKFASEVEEVFVGKDVNEVEYLDGKYCPGGMTALYDGVGTAIDKIGKWLDSMKEEDKPEKTLVVIMTDGGENYSKEYSAEKVKKMIKHQEEKYSWSFVYMGSDLKDATDANTLGISSRGFASKANYIRNYEAINSVVSEYRCSDASLEEKNLCFESALYGAMNSMTDEYAASVGINADDLKSNKKNNA